ncbi:MAG: DEAD/DEAH box helicase, partial [Synergistaceae bacterium]|nr:DEAD/DEAH box helicase [Synergistaceae bacterium]
ELERRPPYAENDNAYDEFVRAFTFNETADQLKAVDEIMKDLSSNFPMDRLLVGDVGFGKTEVALRAAFRVVMAGFQVCVLVPTTILAQQHYAAFQSRLSGFPVNVGLLSRFITPKQAREVLKSTEEGKVDILIGTHKLLQKGVKFRDLGLLIIDEEHRFGVMHKESLKLTYGKTDVLSLSATPIPRTLEMALRGLRSISVLSTPPEDRLPITTYTGQFSAGTIRRAITYELNRGGQVYFLSGKISRMDEYMKMLTAFFPDATIKTAHGQMNEKELESTMLEFYDGKIDILVATTIIESGLDVGRANTIIIDNAEELGLAQMYQLRGRVGRRGEKAFAYFFYPEKSKLNQDTLDRLEAISTMTELGSGYEIARRDLDIRGGGEAGGTVQHGTTRNSSYNIFYKLLEEELDKLRGKKEPDKPEINSDRGGGFIPENYIPQDDVRITLYRRLINAIGLDEIDALCDEMSDRFGKIPAEVKYLAGLTAVRNFGGRYGVHDVTVRKGTVTVKYSGGEIPERVRKYFKSLGRNVKYTLEG